MSTEGDGRWLVVVFGPAPQTNMVKAYSASDAPKVMWKVARTAAAAAEACNVPAGGHALVVAAGEVRRFDRALTAPLVEQAEVDLTEILMKGAGR